MSRRTLPITVESMRGTLPRGGTVLGATRGSPLDSPDGVDRVRSTISEMGIDGLVIIGGNGSLTVGEILFREHGIPVLGVPKTIDNDIEGTDLTFGFNTAVQIATDAIDRLHTTAESHDRVMVVEVMGRHSGWIATHAGLAGGAAVVLIPERPFDIDEVCERLVRRHSRGRFASIVVVAEDLGQQKELLNSPIRPEMSTGTFVWEESEALLQPKLVFELASRPDQFFSVTCSAAERQRHSTECFQPGLELPLLTPRRGKMGINGRSSRQQHRYRPPR